MRMTLRLAALAIAFLSLVFWLFGGPHFGRSQMAGTNTAAEPAQQQEHQVTLNGFVPGIDFLLGSFLGAGILFSCSFIVRQS